MTGGKKNTNKQSWDRKTEKVKRFAPARNMESGSLSCDF